MERTLRKEKLLETAERLSQRIAERFPKSGLSRISLEVDTIIKEAVVRAETIRRPNLWLRGGLVLLVLVAMAGIAGYIQSRTDRSSAMNELMKFLDESKGVAAYLVGGAIFLVTLEVRFKRRRALQAIHELRALAHIIDMHQLTKDPDQLGSKIRTLMVSGRPMNVDSMGRYLHYCTELLALISKVGQLYVQDFPDSTALAAVDQFENLATGLSSKIWQKLMILERIRADAEEAEEAKAAAPAATNERQPVE